MLILITDRSALAARLSPLLLQNGIYHLCTPLSLATFTCEKEDTGAVVLDAVTSLSQGEHICAALKRSYPDLPVAMIAAEESRVNAHADMILRDGDLDRICEDILSLCYTNGWVSTPLSTFYLRMEPETGRAYYMGFPLSLSPTEFRILHCIFYRSPRPTGTELLLALCGTEGPSDVNSLGVLIHRINKRAAEIDARPLVVNEYARGYRLRDGIL